MCNHTKMMLQLRCKAKLVKINKLKYLFKMKMIKRTIIMKMEKLMKKKKK